MNLSFRLNKVKDTVLPCVTVCDIGCDHGYVAISLIKDKKAEKVIACDINKGPVEACISNVSREGLSEKIDVRLADGLSKVSLEDAPDCIVIAGMGGALMTKILSEGIEVVKCATQLVLQPQSELFLVRKWLRENGYNIVSESFFSDMGKQYFVMDVRVGQTKEHDAQTERLYDIFSGYLIESKDSAYKEYLKSGLEINRGYLSGISEDKQDTLKEKILDIEKALRLMEDF